MSLSKLPIKTTKRSTATRPSEIFRSLTLRGSIQNIWEPQAEALNEWDKTRESPDVAIQMNTGGGKTLVGLIIAQSLVNETQGKVLYVCPTNQLVEQTAEKAQECGIQTATYMKSLWSNTPVYDQALGPCLTNYAAVFNGKSIFRNSGVKGIIFDDAHVAGNFVRGQYTLKIPKEHLAFPEISNLFKNHFVRNGQTQQFEDATNGDWMSLLFVPTFEIQANVESLRKILIKHNIDKDHVFVWVHLKDHLSRCAILISGSRIEITPALLPMNNLPYFRADVRRIYLTATVPSEVELLRTFGICDVARITPGGKSGEAQRQFLFPIVTEDSERRESALQLLEEHKACIITPSDRLADEWCPPATKFDGSSAALRSFASATGSQKLALAARYDGIDLPGDACRVLVLAGMPSGENLMDRFIDQTLRIERIRTAHVAARVVQAIGRIFRGNTDHGAVAVANHDLERWLVDPQNLGYMPSLLQQQIKLGIELKRMVQEGHTTATELLNAVLSGSKEWDKLYSEHVKAFETHEQSLEPAWFVDLVKRERLAFDKLWKGDPAGAASLYSTIAAESKDKDARLSAWYRHWEGLALTLSKNFDGATRAYMAAAAERSELGRPAIKQGKIVLAGEIEASAQAQRIAHVFKQKHGKILDELKRLKGDLAYGTKTNPVEQAIKEIGDYLGLESSRPEKDFGTGPDVLWLLHEKRAGAAIEAKTNKKPQSQYQKKDDIGQFHDHIKWINNKFSDHAISNVIVGRKLSVSRDSNPPGDLRIVSLEQFHALADRIEEFYEYLQGATTGQDTAICAEYGLNSLGLSFPKCFESLESWLAIDLKTIEPLSNDSGD